MGRRALLAGAATALAWVGLPLVRRVVRSWPERVAYDGPSMMPTLRAGDWLLVDPTMGRDRGSGKPDIGQLIVLHDPRELGRLLVKRVAGFEPDGRLTVLGDAADSSTDSRTFGPVKPTQVIGRAWFRYWPASRIGRPR